jgi:rhodanese-related sulfurtransferase
MDLEVQAITIQTEKTPNRTHFISREEILSRLHDPSFVLLNVMPKETFEAGHIPGSINLPVAEIETNARRLLPQLDREITVYCMGPT